VLPSETVADEAHQEAHSIAYGALLYYYCLLEPKTLKQGGVSYILAHLQFNPSSKVPGNLRQDDVPSNLHSVFV
jgi:hypothetical protein